MRSQLSEVPDDQGNEVKTKRERCYDDVLDIPFFFATRKKRRPDRLPRVLLPLKFIRSIYVYYSVKIHKNIFMHYVQNIIRSVPKPSDVP